MMADTPDIERLLDRLFPDGHSVRFDGVFFCGEGLCAGSPVAVLGTRDHAPIGVELAHRLAGAALDAARHHPGRPILLLIDSAGQRLSLRDELLGLNGYLAHLAQCLDLARRQGSRIIGLIWSEAASGALLATSLLADACYALPNAGIRVMDPRAMARVTRLAPEKLEALNGASPASAPGVGSFLRLGAIRAVWDSDLASRLAEALATPPEGDARQEDVRQEMGETRGGRLLARQVCEGVRRHAPR